MKRFCALLLTLMMALPLCAFADDYINPIYVPDQYPPAWDTVEDDYGIGDPFVLRWNGMYYMYPSSCEDQVRVYVSQDLIDWTCYGYCTDSDKVYFAYAPEVIYWRGSFYMITSPNGKGHYILKSDSPLGPFVEVTQNFGYAVDGAFFKLDDGQLMMFYPGNCIIESVVLDERTMLPAKMKSSTGATLYHWTEGPGVFRRGEWYYLTFTGNHVCSTGYQVSYASKKGTPTGNFAQREDATIIINSVYGNDFNGLGHSANVVGPDLDSMYITYHNLYSLAGPARLYNVDRLFTNNGLLYTSGPSNFEMPYPEMPDVYGDAQMDLNSFEETADGYFVEIEQTPLFTQEWNFYLNGDAATVLIGQKNDQDVTVTVEQNTIILQVGGTVVASAELPEIGPANCLHTLRVENTPELLYLYIDDMRVLTQENAAYTAQRIGTYLNGSVTYSFMACTAEALGSSDNTALKVIPGNFSARHALNANELTLVDFGTQNEMAALLGKADYNVRIVEDGEYCFDFLVRKEDAGKAISVALNGETLWTGMAPEFTGRTKYFTFTSDAVLLPQGDHTLTITAEDVLVNRVTTFRYTAVEEKTYNFEDEAQADEIAILGSFNLRAKDGILRINASQKGFALFGDEGLTDYALDVTFEIPRNGSGDAGIIVRATDVSLYDSQVADSYFGYGIVLSERGVTLKRARYATVGSTSFASVPSWANATTGSLRIEVRGSLVEIYLPNEAEPIITLNDAKPLTHGMFGFFSTGKEMKILECTVTPLD